MRILAMAHAYPPTYSAGAEMTMHAMLRHLAARGHDVHVQLSRPGPATDYVFEDVLVHPHVDAGSVMPYFVGGPGWRADVVLAHLENTLRAAALCGIHEIPMVHLVHNTHDFTRGALRRGPCQLAVFNADWVHEEFKADWAFHFGRRSLPPSIVVHPPVIPQDYQAKHGKRITLINLTENKGGHLFWQLARALPDKQFLGIEGGYGEQINEGPLDNVVVYGHLPPSDMASIAYGQTKILLMPSSYESYGRTAIEAAYCGIPTIAHPTPGLKEALGDAGVFVDRDDLAGWVAAIKYLSSPRGFSAASQRARRHADSLDPTGDLDRFADAMEGVVRRGFATTG